LAVEQYAVVRYAQQYSVVSKQYAVSSMQWNSWRCLVIKTAYCLPATAGSIFTTFFAQLHNLPLISNFLWLHYPDIYPKFSALFVDILSFFQRHTPYRRVFLQNQ